MKDVQDRIVQFSNRYKLTNVETGEVLGTFDFDEVTGTVEQVGTEIDAELFKNFAQIDGNYPNLGAGYLAKNIKIAASTNNIGWWKIGTLNIQDLGTQSRSSSTIFLVNGLYAHSRPSGLLELNGRIQSGSINAAATTLNILSGNLEGSDHCIAIAGDIITLYGYLNSQYVSEIYTVLQDSSEGAAQLNANLFNFDTEYYGASAPANAIYAVNRNMAAYDGDGNQISTTYAKQTGSYPALGAGYLAKTVTVATTNNSAQYGWWRFARLPFSTLTSINGTSSYSAILLVNSVNPSGISSKGAIQSGLIELDLRLDGGEPTNINTNDVMKVLCGGLSPNLFCCTVSDTEIEFYVYLNGDYNRRNFTVLNEVYYNGERVDALEFESAFVSSSAPANAVYAVVRNIASYAESIPAASQTVLGGTKMWVSDGKLYIKTT